MKRCIAPCVNKCTKEEYDHFVDGSIKFLKGQDKEVLKDLQAELEKDVEALEFEKAAEIFQIIRQIEKTIEGQKVDKPLGEDADAFGCYRQGDEVVLCQLIFRSGKLVRIALSIVLVVLHKMIMSCWSLFCYKISDQQTELPHEILLSASVPNAEAIAEIISTNRKRTAYIFAPQRGEKLALVQMAIANAESYFRQKKIFKLYAKEHCWKWKRSFI